MTPRHRNPNGGLHPGLQPAEGGYDDLFNHRANPLRLIQSGVFIPG